MKTGPGIPIIVPLMLSILLAGAALPMAGCASTRMHSRLPSREVREKLNLGDRLLQTENYAEAARVLAEAVHIEPGNAEAQYYFGVASFGLGEYAQAEKALKESLRLNKRNPDAHNVLGLVYNQTGDRPRA